uniref:Immunoglobulin V-set domain-containing protein n=1 Tax=Cyprinus carpio TaxID=7962 RepID=A0A8C2CWZ9_CYPCA
MLVMEGHSDTLQTGFKTKEQEMIKWYFKDICIAQITGDLSYICTDVQCNEGTERFRDRLKLDHQTGSLTITNIRTTDSGDYELKINNSRFSENTFMISVYASVMEGDSVTLFTRVKTNQQNVITWYSNETIIAEITGDLSFICTDVQCNEDGTERFRDRLKLDNQTGSLTIRDIRTTDSGYFRLFINKFNMTMTFSITVQGESLCLKASLVHLIHTINVFRGIFCIDFQRCFFFLFTCIDLDLTTDFVHYDLKLFSFFIG